MNALIWKFTGASNQKFKFLSDSTIQVIHSGLSLDVAGGVKQGAPIIQWEKHGGANQKWE